MIERQVTSQELEDLIEDIHKQFHYDFRQYSRSSLRRRTEQAMLKYHCRDLQELRERLKTEAGFFPKLITYLTVNTTEMFRDPNYFLALKEKVFPWLRTFPSIKVWVAGCSTGEEVISLSILLREAGIKRHLIYATDINPMNLDRAQRGIYDIEAVRKASLSYRQAGGIGTLSDYYLAAYDSAQFDAQLLENVVFSDHSLATDSVFSEMHLISCRNVLIYFERPLQERVFRLFDQSLVRGGFLGLGNKETMQFSSVFGNYQTIDRENKIYQKSGEGHE